MSAHTLLAEHGRSAARPRFRSRSRRCPVEVTGGTLSARVLRLTRAGTSTSLADDRTRGQELLARLPAEVVSRNRGRFVAFDLASGRAFIGDNATDALLQAEAGSVERVFLARVGYPHAYRFRAR